MSIPIPSHLRSIAFAPEEKRGNLGFQLKCSCGSEHFRFYKGAVEPTPEEKKIEDEFNLFLKRCGPRSYSFITDDEGRSVACRKNLLGKIVDSALLPTAVYPEIYRVKCVSCHASHTVFDTRYHGYDAVASLIKNGEPTPTHEGAFDFTELSPMGSPYSVTVVIENDPTLEDFHENAIPEATEEQYSDAYSWITVIGIPSGGGKQVTFLDIETA